MNEKFEDEVNGALLALDKKIEAVEQAIHNVHVRIDRITIPAPPVVKGFWARLFGRA